MQVKLSAIYSSIACETCDWYRRVGSIRDLCSMCQALATIAHNLAIAAALHRTYRDGVRTEFARHTVAPWIVPWAPGCGRIAP